MPTSMHAFDSQDDRVALAGWRVQDERAFGTSRDPPAVVVQQHVMEPAEQHAAVDVGAAVVFDEVIAVVGLAVRRGALASGPDAAAVTRGERHPLPRGVEALFATEVERVAVSIESDLHGAVRRTVPGR